MTTPEERRNASLTAPGPSANAAGLIAGVSAFPMSARVAARIAQEEDPGNYLIMHAVGANVAGIVASVMAAGLLLTLVR